MKLKHVKKACQITDQIFHQIIQNFSFKTEKELANFILKQIKTKGLKPSFPPIVSSYKNYHDIHHKPKKDLLSRFVIIDFGVKYKGYCSDLTRTVFIGKPKRKDLKLYQLVIKTQHQTIQKIKISQKYQDLDAYSRKILGSNAKFFRHALGHGVGRKIHQKPKISRNSKDKIRPGDIITIEPGLYKKNRFGIRIEDTIYIRKKPQILTKSSKKLFVFPNIYK
ncbi:M24 family metallopeptidase [Candidatus Woesearchaeota archaeon]|nr:M24 family metallopeptidase [Candidatus Woesearchaeota archaeon]